MNRSETCGQGLSERATVPERLGALSAAMADNLEQHQRALDLTDENANAEREAYELVSSDLRNAAAQLQTAANTIESAETRTRQMERRLKDVEALPPGQGSLLPDSRADEA